MNHLTHSDIEYLKNKDGSRGYNWSFASGCNHWQDGVCPIGEACWAKRVAEQYGGPGSFTPQLHPEGLLSPLSLKKPSRIGVCFTGDLFGDWVDPERLTLNGTWVLDVIDKCPQHDFLFLTKAPWNYQKWATTWPDNTWLGASVCNQHMLISSSVALITTNAKMKWLSIEPLLELFLNLELGISVRSMAETWQTIGIKFVVIGAATGTKKSLAPLQEKYPDLTLMPYHKRWSLQPPIEWVREIERACTTAGIKYWEKDNLQPLLKRVLRQEMPE